MKVTLLHITPLSVLKEVVGVPYRAEIEAENFEKVLCKVAIHKNHSTLLEHAQATFKIEGVSRACLQEIARHRFCRIDDDNVTPDMSLTVESTRFTLKKLLHDKLIKKKDIDAIFVYPDELSPELRTALHDCNLHVIDKAVGFPDEKNDKLKYLLNENYAVNLILTTNLRSLFNFLNQRMGLDGNNNPHFEIKQIASEMLSAVQNTEYRFLILEYVEHLAKKQFKDVNQIMGDVVRHLLTDDPYRKEIVGDIVEEIYSYLKTEIPKDIIKKLKRSE